MIKKCIELEKEMKTAEEKRIMMFYFRISFNHGNVINGSV